MPDNDCPLTLAQRRLLQACVECKRHDDITLAEALDCSPSTVKSRFKRIFQLLRAHSRFQAVLIALENRWVTLPPPPPRLKRKSGSPRGYRLKMPPFGLLTPGRGGRIL